MVLHGKTDELFLSARIREKSKMSNGVPKKVKLLIFANENLEFLKQQKKSTPCSFL